MNDHVGADASRARGVEHVVGLAGGDQQPRRRARAQHRHQRHQPGPAADDQQLGLGRRRPTRTSRRTGRGPRTSSPSRATSTIHGETSPSCPPRPGDLRRAVLGRGRDRVAALRAVAVLGGQPHVDVLARPVAVPVRDRRASSSPRAASPADALNRRLSPVGGRHGGGTYRRTVNERETRVPPTVTRSR